MENKKNLVWAFFGTSDFSVIILDCLVQFGFVPSLIVTTEDKPKGRHLILTAPPVKIWAEKNNIKYIQPKTLRKEESVEEIKSFLNFDLFIVASYGKIIPQTILDLPKHGTFNVHPSLLPRLRGASPIQSSILTENETGVSIMLVDADVDHGPILAQEKINSPEWPPYASDLAKMAGELGGKMLADIIPKWLNNEINPVEQNHNLATFCGKIEKEMAELKETDSVETKLRKIRAYEEWPGAFFFTTHKNKKIRIIVKRARIENNELVLERIIPEGRKEMSYADFLKGLRPENN